MPVSPLDSIRRVLDRADDTDRSEGSVAYARYNRTLARIGADLGFGLLDTAATFVALSPNNDYWNNLRSMVTLLDGKRRGLGLEDLTVSTYRACAARAWRVLEGEDFLSFTKGPKTRNFYQNILDPRDPFPITIDGHMMSIWVGERMTMKQAVMKRLNYNKLADGYREVASEVGMIPNVLQATLWFTWKRINNIIFDPQTDAFRHGDQWGLDLSLKDIRPYERREKTQVDAEGTGRTSVYGELSAVDGFQEQLCLL